jgi:hypothetical protein
MPDTAGAADTYDVGVDVGTLPGRAEVIRDGRGTGTVRTALTETPGTGHTTLWRKGRER